MSTHRADYVVSREQVMKLTNTPHGREQDEVLRSILGECDSIWKDLKCCRYAGHQGYHSSGEVDRAWASWERTDGE